MRRRKAPRSRRCVSWSQPIPSSNSCSLLRSIVPTRSTHLFTNPVQTLDQYFNLIAFNERAQPGRMVIPTAASTLYQRLDQGLGFLFFVSDQPLPKLSGRGYFNNSIQYYPPYNAWLKTFVRSWGKASPIPPTDGTRSPWPSHRPTRFLAFRITSLDEDASHWHTFNQFFARHLKSPAARPFASPDNNSVVASPVDAIPQGSWRIDGSSNLVDREGAALKSCTAPSIAQRIGEQSAYKDSFAGGTFTHTFLDVGDYHRYHFPLSGVVREARVIPGSELPGGVITWARSSALWCP